MSLESYYAECPRGVINQIFNTTGMTGWVCAVPARPDTLDISGCCTGKYHVDGDCIQSCETPKDFDFLGCVNRGVGNSSDRYKTLCTNTSANEADRSSADGKDTRKENGAGEFGRVLLGWLLDLGC
jgi:hypothetical protein